MDPIKELRKLDKATLLAIAKVSGGDGHTLFDPDAYRKAGMPEALVKEFTRTYKSDKSDPKHMILGKDGKVVKSMDAVYGLDVVECIRRALEIPSGGFMGRGWMARYAFEKIEQACS